MLQPLESAAQAPAHGDALLLHSGTRRSPSSSSSTAARPASTATRSGRGWRRSAPSAGSAPPTPLDVELMMVSHIDDDHVSRAPRARAEAQRSTRERPAVALEDPPLLAQLVRRHPDNDDLRSPAAARRSARRRWATSSRPRARRSWPASSRDASSRKLLDASTLGGNPPFKGLVLTDGPAKAVKVGDLKITVVAPAQGGAGRAAEEMEQGDQAAPEERAEPGAARGGRRLRRQVGAQPVEHRRPRRVPRQAHPPDRRRPRRPYPRGLEGGEAPEGRQAAASTC